MSLINILTGVLVFFGLASGFMPYDWRAKHFGGGAVSHKKMTRDAYETLAKEFWPDVKVLTGSMISARDQWATANAGVDSDQYHSANHCDAENFSECHALLLTNKKGVIEALKATHKRVSDARSFLGQALHTLQDFYSHSNWIEMNDGDGTKLNQNIGVEGIVMQNTDEKETTCGVCSAHIPDGTEAACIARCEFEPSVADLTDLVKKGSLFLPVGLNVLGVVSAEIVHDLLEAYCIEACECHDCSADVKRNILTSGYYGGEDRKAPDDNSPVKKCVHGGHGDSYGRTLDGHYGGHAWVVDSLQPAYDGINKDSLDCGWSPHHQFHEAAVKAATLASEKFIREIAKNLTMLELKLLFGVGPTLAFAIDTTGSMGTVISSVRTETSKIIDQRVGQVDEPALYVLSQIQDPPLGDDSVISETDATKFKGVLSLLSAAGGGDCPEYSMTGTIQALNALGSGGDLFVITDTQPKDPEKLQDAISIAKTKGIRVWVFLFNGCGAIFSDANYYRLATETGGAFIGPLSYGDAASITRVADDIVRANGVSILTTSVTVKTVLEFIEDVVLDKTGILDLVNYYNTWKKLSDLAHGSIDFHGIDIGKIGGEWAAGKIWRFLSKAVGKRDVVSSPDTWSYFLPIDSTMSHMSIQLTGKATIQYLIQPNGVELSLATGGNTTMMSITNGTILSIKSPIPGFWLLGINVTNDFTMSVSGVSSLHFSDFGFAKIQGRNGHDGYEVISGVPEPGSLYPVLAVLDGDFEGARFSLRSKENRVISNYSLEAGSGAFGEPGNNSFFGNLTAPSEAFMSYVYGFDKNGAPFQRVFAGGLVVPSAAISNSTTNTTTISSISQPTTKPYYSNSTSITPGRDTTTIV
jgi:hypothetical protein